MSKKGFTLAELLIVVAIIGVLTAIAIPVFSSQLEKSREATDIANLRSAKAAAVAKYLADDLTDGTFYFDAQKGTLIAEADFTDGDIAGYGKGTDKTGNAANTFNIEAVADGAISMSWVDTDGASNENTANYAANSVVSDQIIKIVFDSSATAVVPGAPGVPGAPSITTTPVTFRLLDSNGDPLVGWSGEMYNDEGSFDVGSTDNSDSNGEIVVEIPTTGTISYSFYSFGSKIGQFVNETFDCTSVVGGVVELRLPTLRNVTFQLTGDGANYTGRLRANTADGGSFWFNIDFVDGVGTVESSLPMPEGNYEFLSTYIGTFAVSGDGQINVETTAE